MFQKSLINKNDLYTVFGVENTFLQIPAAFHFFDGVFYLFIVFFRRLETDLFLVRFIVTIVSLIFSRKKAFPSTYIIITHLSLSTTFFRSITTTPFFQSLHQTTISSHFSSKASTSYFVFKKCHSHQP